MIKKPGQPGAHEKAAHRAARLVNGLRLSWKFYIESCLLGKSPGQFMGVSFISKPPAIYLIKKA
jgi:hypothetical protein